VVAQYVQAGLAVASLAPGLKGRSAAKRGARAALRLQGLQRFRQRLEARRSFRQQEAEQIARAGNSGSLGDSSVIGALGAFTSQTNSNVAFATQEDRLQDTMQAAGAKVQKYQDLSNLFSMGSQFAGSFASTPTQPTNTPTNTPTTIPPVTQAQSFGVQPLPFESFDSYGGTPTALPVFSG